MTSVQDPANQAKAAAYVSTGASRLQVIATAARERWNALSFHLRTVIAAGLLLALLLFTRGPAGEEPAACSDSTSVAALVTAPQFRQLPCFSGSCENWAFVGGVGVATLPSAACDDLAAQFGCRACKKADEVAPELQRVLNMSDTTRWALCPTPPRAGRVVTSDELGVSFTAMRACAPRAVEKLRVYQMPCWSGSCDNYLLESDARGLLAADDVCDFWSAQFGCGACKTAAQVAADVRLQTLSTSLPPGRAPTGRITACLDGGHPHLGTASEASGIRFTVSSSAYWTSLSLD
jgi:hypothetical protein